MRGLIVLSDDNGETWRQVPAPVSLDLVAVYLVSPRTGWATGQDGIVLHTADGGATWSSRTTGLLSSQVVSLTVDPRTPTTLYAGTVVGLFKSTDGSATWNLISADLSTEGGAVVVDPLTPTTLSKKPAFAHIVLLIAYAPGAAKPGFSKSYGTAASPRSARVALKRNTLANRSARFAQKTGLGERR